MLLKGQLNIYNFPYATFSHPRMRHLDLDAIDYFKEMFVKGYWGDNLSRQRVFRLRCRSNSGE